MIPQSGLIARAFDSKSRGLSSRRGTAVVARRDARLTTIKKKSKTGALSSAVAAKRARKTINVADRRLIRIGVSKKNPTANRAQVTRNTRRQARKYRRYTSGSVIRPA